MPGSRKDRRWPGGVLVMLAAIAAPATGSVADDAGPGMRVVELDALSPLSARDEITRRLLSPLGLRAYQREVAKRHLLVADQTIAAGTEHYDLFVPAAPPGGRYGLLVFVSPAGGFVPPQGWTEVLSREGLVMISARASGNDQDMLERRVPLALNGYGYAIRHFAIDPRRVYIAGFSGGGRTAQLVGVAYPDVFRGILTFSGSDPFGETAVAPPPRELMRLVQARTRVVQSTGTADEVNIAIDGRTRRSMAALCVANVAHADEPRLGHGLPRGRGLSRALKALQAQPRGDPGDAACEAALQARIERELDAIAASIDAGRIVPARKALLALDAHYGWLAAPGSVQAMERIETVSGTP
jgi:predicted esterase